MAHEETDMTTTSSVLLPALLLGAALLPFAAAVRQSAPASSAAVTAPHESPFACDRLALNPQERARHFDELGPILRELRKNGPQLRTRELADGYEFEFPSDTKTYALLTDWAAGERACCPFFDVTVRAEREGGPVWLRLTGREGTKAFIHGDFAPWFRQ